MSRFFRCLAVLLLIVGAVMLGGCYPNFSPDGKQLVFEDGGGVATIDVDGKGYKRIWRGNARPLSSWSPDGKAIIFNSGTLNLALQAYDFTSGKVRVIATGFTPLSGPIAWRPDGRRFIVAGRLDESEDKSLPQLRTFSWPECKIQKVITLRHKDALPAAWNVVWLKPNEDDIICHVNTSDIYRFTGDKAVRLTTTGDVVGMTWYPTHQRIFWLRSMDSGLRLFSMRADGGDPKSEHFELKIATGRGFKRAFYMLRFSPNSSKVLVCSAVRRTGKPAKGWYAVREECHAIDVFDKNQSQLLYSFRWQPHGSKVEPPAFSLMPAWSPDEKRVAINRRVGNFQQIIVCSARGGDVKVLHSYTYGKTNSTETTS